MCLWQCGSGDQHPVQQHVDDLVGAQVPAVADHGVAGGEGQQADDPDHLGDREPQLVAVRLQDPLDLLEDGFVPLLRRPGGVRRLARWPARADRDHQVEDLVEALLHDRRDGQHPDPQRQGQIDRGQFGHRRARVEGLLDRHLDQLVLVLEDAEDGPFGDPGRFGDVLRGDPHPVLREQRDGGGDEHLAPLLGRHPRRPGGRRGPGLAGGGKHGATLAE